MFFKDFSEKGFNFIKQLYDDDEKLIHFADTGLTTKQYLQWRGLVDAIPYYLKKSKYHDHDNDISLLINRVKIYLKDISTKKSYEYLTNRKVIIKTTAMEHFIITNL